MSVAEAERGVEAGAYTRARARSRAIARGLVFLLSLGAPTALQAQSILGRVVDADSGNPVVGAVVLLLDGEGERLDAKLTDDAGSFGFVGALQRPYRLRAEMIGRRGVEIGPFTLEGDARHALELPAEPIRLSGLDVTGEERCSVDPESARAVYTVWAEVEKALRATEVTRSSTAHRYRIVEFDRWRERRSLDILEESSSQRLVVGDERPFSSLPPDEIEADGYVSMDGDEVWIYGPSAEVLLSPYFLRMHCFTLSRDASRPGWITLEFEPVDGRDVPELRGLLWIDETSAQLQALEFEYVNLPRRLVRGDYTGSMQFRRLDEGGLIVNNWWLRSPHPMNRDRLREQAGSVVEVLPGSPDESLEALVSLDGDLPGWMDEAVVPGLALAVVTSDSLWTRAYGVTDANEGHPVVGTTLFEAASLSKPVFARMAMMEVGRGTIDLDAPLAEYWAYPDLQDDEWADAITARMVMTHRSGLPNWRRDQPLSIEFAPGDRFQYSGEGYVYLDRALAVMSGQSLEERAQRMVLAPLGMERSSFTFRLDATDYAIPHDGQGRPLEKRSAPPPGNPAASLHTTATDYGRFIRQLLREIRSNPSVLAALTDGSTPVAEGVEWGLGWGVEYRGDRGAPALWHWGDNGPFKAFVYVDPLADRGFVFFANSHNGLALTQRLLERLFPGHHPLLRWLRYDQLD